MKQGSALLQLVYRGWALKVLNALSGLSNNVEAKDKLEALKKERRKLAEEIVREFTGNSLRVRLEEARKYVDRVVKYVRASGYGVALIRAVVEEESKLLVHASSGLLESVFEVGMAWDHVLDLPFIPGSSIKGAVRSIVEDRDFQRGLVYELFGSQEGMGCLVFLDAYPVEVHGGRLLEIDVITPHYYRGGEPVATELDAQPVPVVHVAVAPGTVFAFPVAYNCSEHVLAKLGQALKLRAQPQALVLAVLVGLGLRAGLGARTTRGYGVFRVVGFEAY